MEHGASHTGLTTAFGYISRLLSMVQIPPFASNLPLIHIHRDSLPLLPSHSGQLVREIGSIQALQSIITMQRTGVIPWPLRSLYYPIRFGQASNPQSRLAGPDHRSDCSDVRPVSRGLVKKTPVPQGSLKRTTHWATARRMVSCWRQSCLALNRFCFYAEDVCSHS